MKSRIDRKWGRVKLRLLAAYARRKGLFLGQVRGVQRDQTALVVTILLPPQGTVQSCVALDPHTLIDSYDEIGEGVLRGHRVHSLDPRGSFDQPIDEGIAKLYLAAETLEEELCTRSEEKPEPAAPSVH